MDVSILFKQVFIAIRSPTVKQMEERFTVSILFKQVFIAIHEMKNDRDNGKEFQSFLNKSL